MSLIVASSSQEQYGGVERSRTQTIRGIEAPAQFQNHFTSPIKIPSNAEIAVESVKIRRDALVDVESAAMMYKYFGKLQTTNSAGAGWQQSRLEMPIPIRPTPGVYNTSNWLKEIRNKLNLSYGSPEIFQTYSIAPNVQGAGVGAGEVIGVKIASTQKGNGKNENIVVDTANKMLSDYWKGPFNLSNPYRSSVSWTSTHVAAGGGVDAHKLITRKEANVVNDLGFLDTMGCSMIGHGHPFCLVEGKYEVFVKSAMNGWRVGLARPQMEYIRDTTKTTASRQRANLLPGTRNPQEAVDNGAVFSTNYNVYNAGYRGETKAGVAGGARNQGRYQKDFYDFMVECDGTKISVFQLSYDNTFQTNQLVMSEVIYWGYVGAATAIQYTNAEFLKDFTTVEFRSLGDEIQLWFTDGAGADVQICGNTRGDLRYHSFLPIGETRNALYPRINIAKQDDTVQVFQYTSHYAGELADGSLTDADFRYPTFDFDSTTFTTGDDFYTNNRVSRFQGGKIGGDDNKAIVRDTKDRPYCLSQTLICDTKDRMLVDQIHASTAINEYDGALAGNAGVDKSHAFIIGFNEPTTQNDYLEGKYATAEFAGQAKMNSIIGFPEKSFIDQVAGVAEGYVVLSNADATATFTSFKAPAFRVHSAFVRISNMPIQSYNGAKTSVSKILYHLPRFTNDGREYGDLFFAPGEKTYVKLHNATPEILNNIEVQIVDVNERPVQDISGNTIVVFHLKGV